LNDEPDSKMDPFDAAVFRQIGEWGQTVTGYPTVSGFQEFTYEPDKPLYGELANFAYQERGAIGFVCELWDFWKQVGFEVKRPFMKNYEDYNTREAILKIAEWDRAHNESRIVGSWRPVSHPQLGAVEVGGYDPLIGVWNPPYDRLAEVCQNQSRFFLRLAALAPRLTIAGVTVEKLEGALYRISATVENRGFLPSYFLGSAKNRSYSDPVRVKLTLGEGLSLVSGVADTPVGHLMGWGGNDRSTGPALARTTTESARRRVSWVVRGSGEMVVCASSTRLGAVESRGRIGD
jgi:hypothetical protein